MHVCLREQRNPVSGEGHERTAQRPSEAESPSIVWQGRAEQEREREENRPVDCIRARGKCTNSGTEP